MQPNLLNNASFSRLKQAKAIVHFNDATRFDCNYVVTIGKVFKVFSSLQRFRGKSEVFFERLQSCRGLY